MLLGHSKGHHVERGLLFRKGKDPPKRTTVDSAHGDRSEAKGRRLKIHVLRRVPRLGGHAERRRVSEPFPGSIFIRSQKERRRGRRNRRLAHRTYQDGPHVSFGEGDQGMFFWVVPVKTGGKPSTRSAAR